jgi:hypothetical protein
MIIPTTSRKTESTLGVLDFQKTPMATLWLIYINWNQRIQPF